MTKVTSECNLRTGPQSPLYTAAMSPERKPTPVLVSRSSWLGPVDLAAYITWAPISFAALQLQRPALSPLLSGDRNAGAAAALLLLFIGLYTYAASIRDQVADQRFRSTALALAQGLCACIANALLPNSAIMVLLILVAAQLGAALSVWATTLWMALLNLAFIAPQWPLYSAAQLLLNNLPVIGFQAFAALTIRYALSAERARDQLSAINSELMATRSLLAESARTEERLRLSRELHDVAGHSLTALKLNLNAVLLDPALRKREELQAAAHLASDLLTQIRQVVGALRAHDGIDLGAALASLAQAIPNSPIHLDVAAQFRVDDVDQAAALLRCAQESITNALRHARATQIDIALSRHDTGIQMKVTNDGRAPDQVVWGNGLNGMRERLQAIGGRLDISTSDQGFVVLAQLPCTTS
jgi:signal transduction histidine kinase